MSDIVTIQRALGLLKNPGELVELRTFAPSGRPKRFHGVYDDHEKLAADAAAFQGDSYFTVNRLVERKPTNLLLPAKTGACIGKGDISRRTLLYLDADPVRPPKTPSTDEQHQAAIELVKLIDKQLPFPDPLVFSSGNGAGAFWKIDLPAESPVVLRVLKTIKKLFEREGETGIDLSVASAARIGRLLGTDNWKGGKGRQSTILSAPDSLEVIPESTLEAYAPAPKKPSERKRVQQTVTSWTLGKTYDEQLTNIGALLKAKGIQYGLENNPDSEGTMCHWFRFAVCPFRPTEIDGRTWIKVHPAEGVSGGCFHAKCQGKHLLDILSVIAPEIAAQAAESFDDAHRLARGFLSDRATTVIWQDTPYTYGDGVYSEESPKSVKASMNIHIKNEFNRLGFKETPDVTTKVVSNAYAAVEAQTFDREEATPHWRTGGKPPASEFLQFANGLLHAPSYFENLDGYFSDPTSDYFTLSKLPYDFNPKAREPKHFTNYCRWQWDDANHHKLLEETLGDILMSDPRQRVFYAWTGRGGSGKSSLSEMIEGMVGESNRCAVNLKDFATDFGLEAAVGKKLILVAEAGVDARHAAAVTENIKRVTGNDPLMVKRKFKTAITIRLDSKILIISNHLLNLLDDSGALFDRMVPTCFTRKVAPDQVDKRFPLKLKEELPGIVLLALKGWQRLKEDGFTIPDTSKSMLNDQREKGSPVLTFVETRCRIIPGAFTPTAKLYEAWQDYCRDVEFSAGKLEDFMTALTSAEPSLRKSRPRLGGRQVRGYDGIKLEE